MKRLVVWGMRFLFLLGVGLFLCPTVQYVQEECIPVLSENYQNYQIEKEINNVTLNYLDSSHISVRGKCVSFHGVDESVLKYHVYEIINCPDYLFDCVETIEIVPSNELEEDRDNERVVASHYHKGDNSKVVLTDKIRYELHPFLHEAIHAFDADFDITSSEEFLKIYEKDKGYDERADEPTEHFAYSYTSYLSNDEDTMSRIPETKKFYDTYHSFFKSLEK